MKSFLAAALLFAAGLFGAQHSPTHIALSAAATENFTVSAPLAISSNVPSATSIPVQSTNTSTSTFQVLSPAAPIESRYVTQDELASQLAEIRSLIYSMTGSSSVAFTDPQVAGNGNGVYYGETAAPVTQLPGSAITNLTASEIPNLSTSYLSTAGGSLTGSLGIGTTSPFAYLSIAGAAGGTQNFFAVSTSTSGFATSTALRISQNGNLHFLNGTHRFEHRLRWQLHQQSGAGIDLGFGVNPYIREERIKTDRRVISLDGIIRISTSIDAKKRIHSMSETRTVVC